jgi:spore coat polysaccharide biosynthesis protein SpsF (cytidylyltransferase family)
MSNQQLDITKFEFLLSLDGNIICQRYFNVKDHVSQARRSMDLHYYVQNICDDISEDLKMKSSNYLCENQNYFLSSEFVEDAPEKDKEHFLLEIKIGEEVFIQRIFPAYWYHPKVRYTVDIRPNLKRILSDLTDILSSEDLETTYLQYEL